MVNHIGLMVCALLILALASGTANAAPAKKLPKLVLVVKDCKGGFVTKAVPLVSLDGGYKVRLSSVAKAMGKSAAGGDFLAPVEVCLSKLGFKAIVDAHQAELADKRAVYVYVSEWRDRRADEFKTMVTLGASIVAGGDATKREKGWAPQLKTLIDEVQSTPVTLFSMGIGSNGLGPKTVAGKIMACRPNAAERLDKHVIANSPDLVIIGDYGLLESRFGTSKQVYREELTDIVRRVHKETGALVVLLGSTWYTNWAIGGEAQGYANLLVQREFSDITADIAKKEGCLYVELLDAFGDTGWALTSDGIHPNDLGHRLIANRIFETLAKNCSCLHNHVMEKEKTSPGWRNEAPLREGFGVDPW